MNIKDYLKVSGLGVVCFAGMILLFNLILHFPVRGQITTRDLKPNFDKTPMELEAEYKNPLPIWEAHKGRIEKLPRFDVPPDNHLSQKQIDGYRIVVMHCVKRLSEFRQKYLANTQGFGKAMALYGFGGVVAELCIVEGQDQAQMRNEEFEWVQSRLFEAALFAVNRKFERGEVRPEEKDLLTTIQQQLCFVLMLYKEGAGKVDYFPEKLKLNNIPRKNVEMFLKNKNKVRYTRINFEKIEFNDQDIMIAAQGLAP